MSFYLFNLEFGSWLIKKTLSFSKDGQNEQKYKKIMSGFITNLIFMVKALIKFKMFDSKRLIISPLVDQKMHLI